MNELSFSKDAIERLLATRKMILPDISGLVEFKEEYVKVDGFEKLFTLSSYTAIPASEYIDIAINNNPLKINRVTISRKDSLYSRVKGDNISGGYHYRHVLTTPVDKNLLALRTTPLSSKEQVSLNHGHKVKEVVYILSGKVGVTWKGAIGVQRYAELECGDSIFIQSWIPHAFYSLHPDAQILAIDYN